MGEAPAAFLAQALKLCDGLARDFLDHFPRKEFPLHPPERRLMVIVLSGPEAYAAYLGIPPGEADGGHYEPATNRLVIFDNRARDHAGAGVARANTIALMHEATHQLASNTGLLDRSAAVPGWLDEGLAMYAEVRSPDGQRKIGAPNAERLHDLREAHDQGRLPRVADLFASDALLDAEASQQAAYALSWLLVYHLLQTPERAAALRDYIAHLGPDRVGEARRAFGDPAAQDQELARTLARLSPRPR